MESGYVQIFKSIKYPTKNRSLSCLYQISKSINDFTIQQSKKINSVLNKPLNANPKNQIEEILDKIEANEKSIGYRRCTDFLLKIHEPLIVHCPHLTIQ